MNQVFGTNKLEAIEVVSRYILRGFILTIREYLQHVLSKVGPEK